MSNTDMFEKVQQLYIEKYQKKITTPIPRKKFLDAGWNEEMFLRYYTECSELYFAHLTCPYCGSSSNSKAISDFRESLNLVLESKLTGKKNIARSNIQSSIYLDAQERNLFFMRLNIFCQFIAEYADIDIDTKGITNLWVTSPANIMNWPFDRRCNAIDSIPIFLPFEEYISWIETTIGEQLTNPKTETLSEISYMPTPEWYFRPYDELKSMYTIALAKVEQTRKAFLQFEDYYSPDGRNQLNDLFYNFCMAKREADDFEDRFDELESGEFNYAGDTLLIYKGETKCFRERHNIEPVTAEVLARRDNNKVSININYCNDCHKYFISEQEFFHYRDLYGIVCKLQVDRSSSGYAHFPMAEYSILRLYGYNVSKEDNYSDEERQHLLQMLIENSYVSKPEIIKYLNMFIKMNGSKDNMEDSVSKWESDLEFVRSFDLNGQPKAHINEIRYAHQ